MGPLLSCLHELCCQRRDLLEVIRKKEREIQDYRDGGASLSRREPPIPLPLSYLLTTQGIWRLLPSRRRPSVPPV